MDQEMKDMELDQTAQDEGLDQDQARMMEELDIAGHLRKGDIKTGTVVEETENGWLVDVGYKCEGFLPLKEWTHRILIEDVEKPQKGDTIEVQVTNYRDGEEAQLTLSRWRNVFDSRWKELEDLLAQSETLEVKGLRKVKGGLMVECCGLEGFIPMSHIAENGRGVNMESFIDKTFEVKSLEKDKRKHRLVFSRKDLVAKESAEQRAKFYDEVHEGDVLEGEVSSITDFGIFVNIGALDGLVHVSEITWKRNVRIKDFYKKGDKVTVKVIGMDKDKDRISLSIKQVQGDPWLTVGERIHKGDIMKGTVTNVTDFGAFVELEPGIEGLIHIGDISWSRVQHPRDTFRKGQEVEVLVQEVTLNEDPKKCRISLGYKQLNDPWRDVANRYAVGQDIKVKVVRLAEFGAFVEAEEGVEALIHISQLSNKRVEKPGDVLHEGQEVVARIIEVNPENRRMRLSLSALEEPAPQQQKQEERPQQNRRERRPSAAETALDDGNLSYNPFAEAFKELNS